ncbi:MAG: cation:proton antiporter [Myxococcales bacterium]|nr:cation:proton antiporter [Myxococcales bacterium]
MKRLLVLAVALGLLLLLKHAAPDTSTSAFDPMTLAAVGFVVLAAFTVGELGGTARLPRITGYILAGVIAGPQVWDLLSAGIVRDMGVFNTLALGLIALSGGIELNLSEIRRVAKALLFTLSAKIPLLLITVGGTFYFIETHWNFLGIHDQKERLVTAVLLSILGIGTSPAIVLAVANESNARGRLAQLSLAMAIVKDLVVVIILAIGIAFAQSTLSPTTSFNADVLWTVGHELLGSLAIGATIGTLLIGYLRFVHQEMLLVVLAVVLVGAEITHALHLELLLVFITAGFIVRNFSEHGEQLHQPLSRVALPVYVVFFATAGAVVDLRASATILPLALALALARMLAYYAASRWGTWLAREEMPIQQSAWLSYWPQAGITLGLVRLASTKLPQLASQLEETGFALVAINLLIGPIALGIALRRTKSIQPSTSPVTPESSQVVAPSSGIKSPSGPALIPPLPPPIENPLPSLKSRLETEPLVGVITSASLNLEGEVDDFVRIKLTKYIEQTQTFTERMLGDAAESRAVVVSVRKTLNETLPFVHEQWEADMEQLRNQLVRRLLTLPSRLEVPLSDGLLVPRAKDPLTVRFSRWQLRTIRRMSHSYARTRTVRLQIIARHCLEPHIASGIRVMNMAHFEHYTRMLDEVRSVIAGLCSPAEAREGIIQLAHRWRIATNQVLHDHIRKGILATTELTAEAGVPGSSASRIRLSEALSEVVPEVERCSRDCRQWRKITHAALDTLRAEALVAEADEVLDDTLHRRVREPLSIVRNRLLPIGKQTAKRLQAVLSEVEQVSPKTLDLASALSKTAAVLPKSDRKRLERARASFGRLTRQTRLPEDLAQIRAMAPDRLALLPPGALRETHEFPERLSIVPVPFALRFDAAIDSLIGQVRDAMTPLETLVLASDQRLRDATHLAEYGVEAAHTWEQNIKDRQSTAARALKRGRTRLEQWVEDLGEAFQTAEGTADAALKETRETLRQVIYAQRSLTVSRVRHSFLTQSQALLTAFAEGWDTAIRLHSLVLRTLRRMQPNHSVTYAAPPDAGSLRRQIAKNNPPSRELELPSIYLKVCDLTPVTDVRFAVAREETITYVSELLSYDRQAATCTQRVVIEGMPGSGKTSFLNIIERNTKGRRIVRIDTVFHPRQQGVLTAIAGELGSADYPLALTQALTSEPTLVLIDDLSFHLMPTHQGIKELEDLLRVVVDSARHTAWAITIDPHQLSMLAEIVSMYGVFHERIQLSPLSPRELTEVIEARIHLAGLELSYPKAPVQYLFHGRNARIRAQQKRYFEQLARASEGNIREAIILHLRSLNMTTDGRLQAQKPIGSPTPPLANLGPSSLTCLATPLRLGPLNEEEMAKVLVMTQTAVRQHTMALMYAGLLELDHRRLLRVPLHNVQPVCRALAELGFQELHSGELG